MKQRQSKRKKPWRQKAELGIRLPHLWWATKCFVFLRMGHTRIWLWAFWQPTKREKHEKWPSSQFLYIRRKISPSESPKILILRPNDFSGLLTKGDISFNVMTLLINAQPWIAGSAFLTSVILWLWRHILPPKVLHWEAVQWSPGVWLYFLLVELKFYSYFLVCFYYIGFFIHEIKQKNSNTIKGDKIYLSPFPICTPVFFPEKNYPQLFRF